MLSQITDAVWMIEVGDELHWDDCKKIGTMTEWNKAIQNFNNKHNEHHIPIFTNYNLTVEKLRIVDDIDDEEEEVCKCCGKFIDHDDDDLKCGRGCPEYDAGWLETHSDDDEGH